MKKGKLFFRRLNRGIALGLVLVLAVVLYTVVTGQTFKNTDKPEIEKIMKSYLSDLAALSVGFQGTADGHSLTEADISARMQEFSFFTDKYFTYKKSNAISGVSAQNIEEIKSAYRDYLESGIVCGEVLSFSLALRDVSYGRTVSKTGPGCAFVSMQIEGLIRTQGEMIKSIYVPGMYERYDMSVSEYGDTDTHPETGDPDAIYEGRCDGYLSLYLEKKDGEWKIVYAENSYIDVYETRIVEGGAGK